MPETQLDNVRVVRIGRSNMSQAQAIFFHAYKDNPFMMHMLNANKRGYEQRLRGMIREDMLQHFSDSNIALAIALGDRLIGAAMVNSADEPEDLGSSWRWRLGMYSVAGIMTTHRLRRYFAAKHNALGKIDHHWILLIGLHPEFQHRGFGHRLMDAIHQECERDSKFNGISVDSHCDHDREFFESLNYCPVSDLSTGDVHIDLMYHCREGDENPFSPATD